jgi:CxxC motif-containing protein
MKEFTCIVCPVSCSLQVDEIDGEVVVKGNQCKRGQVFGTNEFKEPKRMITTTVKLNGSRLKRLPVISSDEVPKARLKELVGELYKVEVNVPVKRGDVIAKNIGETGVDVLASRTVEA